MFDFNVKVTYDYTPIPEPSTLVLAGLTGFGLLGMARRRRS